MKATIADLERLTADARTAWSPTTVTMTKPDGWVPRYPSSRSPAWPIPVTPALAGLIRGAPDGCIAITGSSAHTLLAAVRKRTSAAASWTVKGRPTFLAIGVVVPGFLPCGAYAARALAPG